MTHAWLITGPPGSGRSTLAYAFAAALIAEEGDEQAMRQVLAGTHPDLTALRTEGVIISIKDARALVERSYFAPVARAVPRDRDGGCRSHGRAHLQRAAEGARRAAGAHGVGAVRAERRRPAARRSARACAPCGCASPRSPMWRGSSPSAPESTSPIAEQSARHAQRHIGMAQRLATDAAARARRDETLRGGARACAASATSSRSPGASCRRPPRTRRRSPRSGTRRSGRVCCARSGSPRARAVPPAVRSQLSRARGRPEAARDPQPARRHRPRADRPGVDVPRRAHAPVRRGPATATSSTANSSPNCARSPAHGRRAHAHRRRSHRRDAAQPRAERRAHPRPRKHARDRRERKDPVNSTGILSPSAPGAVVAVVAGLAAASVALSRVPVLADPRVRGRRRPRAPRPTPRASRPSCCRSTSRRSTWTALRRRLRLHDGARRRSTGRTRPPARSSSRSSASAPTRGDAIGSLLTNPGGPGVERCRPDPRQLDFAVGEPLQQQYDVIGFDPRGVGESTRGELLRRGRRWTPTCSTSPPAPRGSDGWTEELHRVAQRVRRGVRREQRRHPAFHHDRERGARHGSAARRAGRHGSCTTSGYSYGTFLGATYAKLFPERVGGSVLDGAVDPVRVGARDRAPRRRSASSRRCAPTWPTA